MTAITCPRCRAQVPAEEARAYAGEFLCEDCYMEVLSPTRTCDPWAVHTARSLKDDQGRHQLTAGQQRLYDLVKEKQEVSFPEAARTLGLKEEEVRREFAVLRHMELLRGCKRGPHVLMTLF
jgi:hypothetical protein